MVGGNACEAESAMYGNTSSPDIGQAWNLRIEERRAPTSNLWENNQASIQLTILRSKSRTDGLRPAKAQKSPTDLYRLEPRPLTEVLVMALLALLFFCGCVAICLGVLSVAASAATSVKLPINIPGPRTISINLANERLSSWDE